mmetsp:Transcript_29050/g.56391  ORF Transcript_29050/g.56391 Transcript_29050/m.56391 type:complete len:256 (-) Transcript_29050:782-1549(-)
MLVQQLARVAKHLIQVNDIRAGGVVRDVHDRLDVVLPVPAAEEEVEDEDAQQHQREHVDHQRREGRVVEVVPRPRLVLLEAPQPPAHLLAGLVLGLGRHGLEQLLVLIDHHLDVLADVHALVRVARGVDLERVAPRAHRRAEAQRAGALARGVERFDAVHRHEHVGSPRDGADEGHVPYLRLHHGEQRCEGLGLDLAAAGPSRAGAAVCAAALGARPFGVVVGDEAQGIDELVLTVGRIAVFVLILVLARLPTVP